jgi:TolB protein
MQRLALVIVLVVTTVAAAGAARGAATSGPASLVVYSESASPVSVPRLRLLNVDTGASRPLAANRFAHNASWAPDGRRLVVEDYGARGSTGPLLAVIDVRSGGLHPLTRSSALDESPAWSPNGRRIVFSRAPLAGPDDGLWLMSASGGAARHVTYNRFGDLCASWSPDGRRIAFAHARNGSGGRDLWLMRSDGTGRHRLLSGASCAAWSPDGAQLAIGKQTGRLITSCGCEATDLYLGDANGGNRRLLVRNGGRATWSPDGSRIVFVRWAGQRTHLWVINSDGSGLRQLTGGTRSQRAPAWQP